MCLRWSDIIHVVSVIFHVVYSSIKIIQRTISMNNDMKVKLKALLIKHEGYSKYGYIDTVGKITVGIGFNVTDRGMDDDWIDTRYNKDVDFFLDFLSNKFPWFNTLNGARQCALIDMCFMGAEKFITFKKMLTALEKGDFERAAMEVIDSKYESEVHQRAHDIANIIRTGEL